MPSDTPDPRYITKDRSQLYVKHNNDLTHPYASPIFSNENPLKPISPMLIQVGDAERLRDDGIVFAERIFKNSPIRLELYQDQVHVFQIFAPFEAFSDHALQRIGNFILEQTGPMAQSRPIVRHQACHIQHAAPFQEIELYDAIGVIDDGEKYLVSCGVWREDIKDRNVNNVKAAHLKQGKTVKDILSNLDVYKFLTLK